MQLLVYDNQLLDLTDPNQSAYESKPLLEALRPFAQPGTQPPRIILPAGHAAGALLSNTKALEALLEEHKATGTLLNDIDLGKRVGIHPRVLEEPSRSYAHRITHAHSKFVVCRAATAEDKEYGWTYVGSHNFSATAWGSRFEGIGLQQCASWEAGVILVVPRETPPAEACCCDRRRMAELVRRCCRGCRRLPPAACRRRRHCLCEPLWAHHLLTCRHGRRRRASALMRCRCHSTRTSCTRGGSTSSWLRGTALR